MKLLKLMKRQYYVTATFDDGNITWKSKCSGFYPFERVSVKFLEEWTDYATKQTGKPCVITNFFRIKY